MFGKFCLSIQTCKYAKLLYKIITSTSVIYSERYLQFMEKNCGMKVLVQDHEWLTSMAKTIPGMFSSLVRARLLCHKVSEESEQERSLIQSELLVVADVLLMHGVVTLVTMMAVFTYSRRTTNTFLSLTVQTWTHEDLAVEEELREATVVAAGGSSCIIKPWPSTNTRFPITQKSVGMKPKVWNLVIPVRRNFMCWWP